MVLDSLKGSLLDCLRLFCNILHISLEKVHVLKRLFKLFELSYLNSLNWESKANTKKGLDNFAFEYSPMLMDYVASKAIVTLIFWDINFSSKFSSILLPLGDICVLLPYDTLLWKRESLWSHSSNTFYPFDWTMVSYVLAVFSRNFSNHPPPYGDASSLVGGGPSTPFMLIYFLWPTNNYYKLTIGFHVLS